MCNSFMYTGKNTVYDKRYNKLVSLKSIGFQTDIYLPNIFDSVNCHIPNKIININAFVGNNFKLLYYEGIGFDLYYRNIKTGKIDKYLISFYGFSLMNGAIITKVGSKEFYTATWDLYESKAYDIFNIDCGVHGNLKLRLGLINHVYTINMCYYGLNMKNVIVSTLNNMYVLFIGTLCFMVDKTSFNLQLVGVADTIKESSVRVNITDIIHVFNDDIIKSLKVGIAKDKFLNGGVN